METACGVVDNSCRPVADIPENGGATRREQGDEKLIWECYVGHEARVSQLLQHLPVRVETYSKQNGWDFSMPQIRGAFLARRSLLHPDEIMMSQRRTPRNATWNILSIPVLGSNRSGVILMVSVSDVRNVDWELNIGDYHTTLSPISRPQNSCWLE